MERLWLSSCINMKAQIGSYGAPLASPSSLAAPPLEVDPRRYLDQLSVWNTSAAEAYSPKFAFSRK
jgi:hypothetical protein